MNADSDEPAQPTDRLGGPALLLPLLCLAGAGVAVYLAVIHYGLRFGELSFGAICGGTSSDCNSVVASRFGTLLGLPVAVWGLWYYLAAGALSVGLVLLRRDDRPAFAGALTILTLGALVIDAYLAWAQWARLERWCPLCVATYAINLAILVIAWAHAGRVTGGIRWSSLAPNLRALRASRNEDYYREALKTLLGAVLLFGVIAVSGAAWLISNVSARAEKQQLAGVLDYVRRTEPAPIPPEGPSRGPQDAAVTIVVFSDFMCESCKLASRYLDIVAANHRDDLRIVYRHLPADSACHGIASTAHPGACRLAQAGACAHEQGRFWEFHDVVFGQSGRVKVEKIPEYAAAAGLDMTRFEACMAGPRSTDAVTRDVEVALANEIKGTPALVINGRTVVGALKPWLLEAVIEEARRRP